MDNIIQILVILFIIYSIFGSALGKKKPQNRQQKFPQDGTGEDQNASPKPQYSGTDILEDLFGVKLPKTGNEYPRIPKYPKTTDVQNNSQDLETQVAVSNYDNLRSPEVQPNLDVPVELEKAAIVVRKKTPVAAALKKKFQNPSTLRELYLISEILGKPKSLRR